MRRVIQIVQDWGIAKDTRPLVVLSAAAGVTNALIRVSELALKETSEPALQEIQALEDRHEKILTDLNVSPSAYKKTHTALRQIFTELRTLVRGVHLLGELTARSRDQFQSAGERCSTLIFAAAFKEYGPKKRASVEWVDARDFFITSDEYGLARPRLTEIRKRIRKYGVKLQKGSVLITQGFIGSTVDGVTTTIGRGGSDFSAAVMGVAIDASQIQIWTDVAGILTCDPRIAPKAFTIPSVTFEDATALAFFGAKVLHPETIWPAVQKGIPVKVLSSKEPDLEGTTILQSVEEPSELTGLAIKRGMTLVRIVSRAPIPEPRIQLATWEALTAAHKVPHAVSFSADSAVYALEDVSPIQDLRTEMEHYSEVEYLSDRALITMVGSGLRDSPGIAARIFRSLGKINCEMISYGGSASSISVVVHTDHAEQAARRLHAEFFEA